MSLVAIAQSKILLMICLFSMVTLSIRVGAANLPSKKSWALPSCVGEMDNSDISKSLNNLVDQLQAEKSYVKDIQEQYGKALEIYQSELVRSKSALDRQCLLGMLIALASRPSTLALKDVMADWYNEKIFEEKIQSQFAKDLEAIVPEISGPGFAKKWQGELRQFAELSDD